MTTRTLLLGYEPPQISTLKGAQLKRHTYFQDTLASYNLGEVFYLPHTTTKSEAEKTQPLVVLALGDHIAQQASDWNIGALIYSIDSPHAIFARKVHETERKEKLNRILREVERIISDITKGNIDEKTVRNFGNMSYTDLYKMIKEAMMSDDAKLRDQAHELLFGEGERHSNIIWIRAQIMAEVWQHADAVTRGKLMGMSMHRHIELGLVRQLDNFIDLDGSEYYQYIFLDPEGNDIPYIRRIPCGNPDESPYGYENRLQEVGLPANFLQLQMEANQLKEQWDTYISKEAG